MNKIIILLFALLFFAKIDINGQYFPDTAKTFFATTSQTDWIEVTTFPPWASNDSISGVTVGGINYVRRDIRTTTFDAQSVGILANGSDMSSRIIRVLNNSKVQKLIFTSNGNGIIIINSDITIPSGKNIEIDGVILKGTSGIKLDINNNIVIADINKQIFDTSLRVSNINTNINGNIVPSPWFGLKADSITDNIIYITRASSSTPKNFYIGLPQGKTMIGSTLNITKSIMGMGINKSSSLIYNTSASGTGLKLSTINADSLKICNITFSGSNKCYEALEFANNYKGVEISNCTFRDLEQQGSELSNTAGVLLQNGNDGAWIHHNYFTAINAKNNGVARGIRGTGTTSPKRCIIEYNIFDGISNTGSASLDSDQIVWQDYTDSAGLVIRFNDHYNVYKRAVKIQSPGVLVQGERIWSTAYKSSIVSNSAISLYAKQTQAIDNYIYDGAYENGAIEAGVGDGTPTQDVIIRNNYIRSGTTGSQSARRGIVVYGTNNKSIAVEYNTIYNGDRGIYIAGGGRGLSIVGNKIYNTTDNSILIAPINTYPNNWNYGVQIIGNYVFKCSQAAYAIGRINGGSFSLNAIDSCSDDFILNYSPYMDSLLGVIALGNTSSPVGYGSGKRVNIGAYSQRLPISNPNSLPGTQYYAIDTAVIYFWQNSAWKKF